MDSKKTLLESKLEDINTKKLLQRQDYERKRIIENVEYFKGKYRFANEIESTI